VKKKIPFTCPCHLKKNLKFKEELYICEKIECEHNKLEYGFPINNAKPIFVSEIKTDTICQKNNYKTYIQRPFSRYKKIKKMLIGESQVTRNNCDKFIKKLLENNKNPKVLIIGGAEKGSGTEKLWLNQKIEIHSTDIYITDNVDFICDAHYLPLSDNYYDGVFIQAVLEHVVQPDKVVKEIKRVLNTNGLVYAETPFMQQVHEGAYDFNRYTVLGHRYLFKEFELIEMGGNKGPDVVLTWSINYFFWSILRSKSLAKIISIIFGIAILPFKFLISKKSMHDASSGVFFLGKKVNNFYLNHKDLIKLYKGQFK